MAVRHRGSSLGGVGRFAYTPSVLVRRGLRKTVRVSRRVLSILPALVSVSALVVSVLSYRLATRTFEENRALRDETLKLDAVAYQADDWANRSLLIADVRNMSDRPVFLEAAWLEWYDESAAAKEKISLPMEIPAVEITPGRKVDIGLHGWAQLLREKSVSGRGAFRIVVRTERGVLHQDQEFNRNLTTHLISFWKGANVRVREAIDAREKSEAAKRSATKTSSAK